MSDAMFNSPPQHHHFFNEPIDEDWCNWATTIYGLDYLPYMLLSKLKTELLPHQLISIDPGYRNLALTEIQYHGPYHKCYVSCWNYDPYQVVDNQHDQAEIGKSQRIKLTDYRQSTLAKVGGQFARHIYLRHIAYDLPFQKRISDKKTCVLLERQPTQIANTARCRVFTMALESAFNSLCSAPNLIETEQVCVKTYKGNLGIAVFHERKKNKLRSVEAIKELIIKFPSLMIISSQDNSELTHDICDSFILLASKIFSILFENRRICRLDLDQLLLKLQLHHPINRLTLVALVLMHGVPGFLEPLDDQKAELQFVISALNA